MSVVHTHNRALSVTLRGSADRVLMEGWGG